MSGSEPSRAAPFACARAVRDVPEHRRALLSRDCSATTPFAIGRDEETAGRLWDVSLDLVGLRGYDPLTASEPPAWALEPAAPPATTVTPSPTTVSL